MMLSFGKVCSRLLSSSTGSTPSLRIFRSTVQDPWFNLATEEWLFNHLDPSSHTLFLWRNDKTVVIGRNQNPWKECHLQKMDVDAVKLARRKSGGGAVYQDLGNSCFTFLSPLSSYSKDNNNTILLRALEGFGIKAEPSGRNDLVLTDSKRKFSGSAFKVSRDRAFHHGTLLINVDMEGMTKYLNPNKAKLLSKGITSVQSRVANLSDLCSILTHDNLSANIADEFCAFYDVDPQRVFREDLQYETLSRIDELNGYYDALRDWSWRFGQTPHFTHELEKRFDWATMDICLTSNNGMITEATIYSDSLFPIFVDLLRETLVQAPYDVPGVQKAFANMRKRLHELSQPRVVQSAPEVVAQAVGDARSVFYRTALEEASTISVAERDAMLGHLDEFEKWFVTAM